MKLILKICFTLLLLVVVTTYLFIYVFSGYNYYYLVSVQEVNNMRYALYDNRSWDGNTFIIVEQNLEYQDVKKLKTSDISLVLRTGNDDNRYVYHYFPFAFIENPKLDLYKKKYLTFSIDNIYYFLYDLKTGKKYFNNVSKISSQKENLHNEILEIITDKK